MLNMFTEISQAVGIKCTNHTEVYKNKSYSYYTVSVSVTVSGFNYRCGTYISVCDQPPRSTQPGHPFVGRRNEYQPKGGDALR